MKDVRNIRRKARTRYERYTTKIEGELSASCHSERPPYCHGLCLYCYNKQYKSIWRKARASKHYGVDTERYHELVAQGCPICLASFDPAKKEPVFDHDHTSGTFRGLLCQACNRGIGFLRDSATNATRAVQYLGGDSHPGPCG